jgi:tape measure domain-containing protein
MADGRLIIDSSLDTTGVSNGLNTIGTKIKIGAAAIAGALAVAGTKGIQYNMQMESYLTSFTTMLGDANEATALMTKLKKIAAETPFELSDLAETTKLLMNYGMTAEDATKRMTMLGDISQGNSEKMNHIAMAYGQMSSAGKVQLEDVKQMIEAGFNPLKEISESTGESMGSLYDRITKGTISVDEITASMERSTSKGGKYFKSMEAQSKTLEGRLSTLKDNASEFLGAVMEPLTRFLRDKLLPAAISFFEGINIEKTKNTFQTILNIVKVLVPAIAGMIVTQKAIAGVQALRLMWQKAGIAINLYNRYMGISSAMAAGKIGAMRTIVGVLTGKIKLATVATQLWGRAMKFLAANKIMLIAGVVIAVAAALGLAAKKAGGFKELFDDIQKKIQAFIKKLPEVLSAVANIIPKIVKTITQALPKIINAIVTALPKIINAVVTALPKIILAIVQAIPKIILALAQALPKIIATITKAIPMIVMAIMRNLPAIIKAGVQIIVALIVGFAKAIPQLIKYLPKIIKAIVKGLKVLVIELAKLGVKAIKGLWNGFRSWIGTLGGKVKGFAKSIPGKIKEGLAGITKVGVWLVKGLWNGIGNMVGWIGKKIKGFGRGVLKGLKDFFKIKSPSREMAWIGKMLAVGLGNGIEKYGTDAVLKAKNMASDVMGAMASIQGDLIKRIGISASIGSAAALNSATSQPTSYQQTVNFNQPVQTPVETARQLKTINTFGLLGAQ